MYCVVKLDEKWGEIKHVIGPFFNFEDAVKRAEDLQREYNDRSLAIEDEPWYDFEVHPMEMANA